MPDRASDGPPVLTVDELAPRLASATGLLLVLDFDGTLTPVVDDPDAPSVTDANRRALRGLADAPEVRVAVVSGRALADLRDRVGVEGVTYVGNHGLELHRGGERIVRSAVEESVVRDPVAVLEDRVGDVEGCIVEDKGPTASVHYRQVAPERVGEVRGAVRSTVSERAPDRVEVRRGKAVLELRPAVARDKGTVVRELAGAVDDGWFALYVGDDTTDEDAFRVLGAMEGGLGVRVGDDSGTVADRRVAGPDVVEEMLEWLVEDGVSLVGE